MTVDFRPYLIKARHFRLTWPDIVKRCTRSGNAGLAYGESPIAKVLEFRDQNRILRGALAVYTRDTGTASAGELLIFVDPKYRRRGVATLLLQAAAQQNIQIDFTKQKYTWEDWACVRKFLQTSG